MRGAPGRRVRLCRASWYNIHAGESSLLSAYVLAGGLPPFTYRWSTGAISTSITVKPGTTTTYTITITDALGQTGSASATVSIVSEQTSPNEPPAKPSGDQSGGTGTDTGSATTPAAETG